MGASCAPPVEPGPPAPPLAPPVSFVGCDDVVGGIALDAGLVEEQQGYDDALAALDLNALPARLSLGDLSPFLLSIVAFALDVPAELVDPLDRDDLLETHMGRAVLAGFATADADPYDFAFFRRGFHRYYACSRGLPSTFPDLLRVVELDADGALEDARAAGVIIDDTQPKRPLRRRLWSPPSYPDVFVAETLDDDDAIRETEIVWQGQRDDGNLDFLVYAPDGALSAGSHFATNSGGSVASAAPYTCLFCHGDDALAFNVVRPD